MKGLITFVDNFWIKNHSVIRATEPSQPGSFGGGGIAVALQTGKLKPQVWLHLVSDDASGLFLLLW
jgi:hypothetical protein